MFREEKHRYKSTSRDTEVTVGSKSNNCKKTHPELYLHAYILSWKKQVKRPFVDVEKSPLVPTPAQQLSKVLF